MAATEQQYDTIQGPYDYIRGASIALIERENVREKVALSSKKLEFSSSLADQASTPTASSHGEQALYLG